MFHKCFKRSGSPADLDKCLGKLEASVGPYMYSSNITEDESSDTFKVDFMKVCEFNADTLSEVFAMSADAVSDDAKSSWTTMLQVLQGQLDLFLLDRV